MKEKSKNIAVFRAPASDAFASFSTEDVRPGVNIAPSGSYLRNAGIALVCLGVVIALVYRPTVLDLPFAHLVNTWAVKNPRVSHMFYVIDQFPLCGGVTFLALLWACWFSVRSSREDEMRSRMVAGILVCLPAGRVSRFLQHRLHSHPRPFFDQALGFHSVYENPLQKLNTWNSFPSDHATVYAALVTVICLVRADLRKFVIPWLVVVEFARLYMGAHYPTDLLGGAALGALLVFLVQAPWVLTLCHRVVRTAKTQPFLFYGFAFLLTYQIANLFEDVRAIFRAT